MSNRDALVFCARLAEQVERFEEMVPVMREVVETGYELSDEERSLLTAAYKNTATAKRESLLTLKQIEHKEEGKGTTKHAQLLKDTRLIVENELRELCNDFLQLAQDYLLRMSSKTESRVIFLQQRADFNRYLAEFTPGDAQEKYVIAATEAYKEADELAKVDLPKTNPYRLSLALNYAVFTVDILKKKQEGLMIAKDAFDTALLEMKHLEDETHSPSIPVLQMLLEDIQLWTSEIHEEEGDVDEQDQQGENQPEKK